eukprot:TRINITY_DN7728_c0_g1_i1.p2 TRINITY_DN7728_c0_g1~~TRINITY_DN7728_c0_g1_i1.p2  ORF type:complete len:126 (-),score=10.74 TRINITY_DN7728_c0_g1_i1:48-425(-)
MCIRDSAQCYVACLERFIEFLNKNADIQIAQRKKLMWCGERCNVLNYLKCWKVCFYQYQYEGLLLFMELDKFIFIFLGKIFICAFATFGGYLIITRVEKYDEALSSILIPTFQCQFQLTLLDAYQ